MSTEAVVQGPASKITRARPREVVVSGIQLGGYQDPEYAHPTLILLDLGELRLSLGQPAVWSLLSYLGVHHDDPRVEGAFGVVLHTARGQEFGSVRSVQGGPGELALSFDFRSGRAMRLWLRGWAAERLVRMVRGEKLAPWKLPPPGGQIEFMFNPGVGDEYRRRLERAARASGDDLELERWQREQMRATGSKPAFLEVVGLVRNGRDFRVLEVQCWDHVGNWRPSTPWTKEALDAAATTCDVCNAHVHLSVGTPVYSPAWVAGIHRMRNLLRLHGINVAMVEAVSEGAVVQEPFLWMTWNQEGPRPGELLDFSINVHIEAQLGNWVVEAHGGHYYVSMDVHGATDERDAAAQIASFLKDHHAFLR